MATVIEARVKQKKDTEANWMANELILLDGEQAFVVDSNDGGSVINFKIGDGTKRFSDLPYWRGGIITPQSTPFFVEYGSSSISMEGSDTVITDIRLNNKSDYPISTTQLSNSSFRLNEIEYLPSQSAVKIINFSLNIGELIILYPTGVLSEGGGESPDLLEILQRLTVLEAKTAPINSNGRMWWTGGAIPTGWAEDTEWRDYTPVHAPNPSQIGLAVGSNSFTLSSNQQGSFQVRGQKEISSGNASAKQINMLQFRPSGGSEVQLPDGGHNTWGAWSSNIQLSNGGAPVDVRQRSKYGIWIKYVGG